MLRNNAIILFFQIPFRISLLFLSLAYGFSSSAIRTEQERLARAHMQNNKVWFIFYTVLIIYFILGFLLTNNGNKIKNLLSVSSLFFIGLFLCFIFFIESTLTHNTHLGVILGYMYSFELPFLGPNTTIINFQNIFSFILEIIIPSLFIWLGLETRVSLLKLIRLLFRTNHKQA